MADDKPEVEEAKPSGGGLMSIIPLAVIAAGASFGMVWFATSPPSAVTPELCEALALTMEEVAVANAIEPEELQAREANYITLDPITVTLGPNAGAKHLMMTVSLGVPEDIHDLTDTQFLRLRDQFLEKLRTIDSTMITDPAAMPELKAALLSRAQATLGKDTVYNVLVTDFLMK